VQVRLLGPVDISGGPPPELTGERRRSLLAALAVHAGDLVSVDKIMEAVWDGEPPVTAHNTVQSHVAHLRRLLGGPDAIEHRARGYALRLSAPATDLAAVRELLTEADRLDDPAERVPLLTLGVTMWRGRSLAGVGPSAYLERHAAAVEELRLHTLERLYADRLRLGEHLEVADALRELLAEHPEAELLARIAMVALTRAGLPSDALAVYDQLRRHLQDALGVGTSRATERLRQRIKRADPALLVPGGRRAPTPMGSSAGSSAPASRLVGRETELAQVLDRLESGRLVSVVGMGGIGKTRLLDEVAGVLAETGVEMVRVELDGAAPGTVWELVGRALHIDAPLDQDLRQAVIAAMDARSSLLALDSCEGALVEVASLITTVLTGTAGSRVVATSRVPFHLPNEACVLLGPLGVPTRDSKAPYDAPSVLMLCERARAADRGFRVSAQNIGPIAEICRRVDGLPLALEILGPRLRSLTVHEVADSLSHELIGWQLPDTVPERHRSVSAVLSWSYRLLTEDERHTLGQLSLLRGGAWADELGDLCRPEVDGGLDTLARLVDNSLVSTTTQRTRSRLFLHPLVQTYAQERLRSSGEAVPAARRHAEWTARCVHALSTRLHRPDESTVLSELDLLQQNAEAALEWATREDRTLADRLVGDLWWFWFRTGRSREGRAWIERSLEGRPTSERPAVLESAAGYLAWVLDDYHAAEGHARHALVVSGEPPDQGLARSVLARALGDQGRFAEAAEEARASVTAYAAAGDRWGEAWSGRCLSAALLYDGAVEASEDACRAALQTFESIGDTWGVAGGWELAARIAASKGEHEASLGLALMALEAHQACGDTSGERYTLHQLARTYRILGRLAEAAQYSRAGLELAEVHGYRVGALQALLLLVDVYAASGDADLSAAFALQATELAEAIGDNAALSELLASGGLSQEEAGD
jgi:predicted ATPase/DNA-binding SARP family transcriptional activator